MLAVWSIVSLLLLLIPSPRSLAIQEGNAVRSRVLETDNTGLEKQGFLLYGSQRLMVLILQGAHAGKIFSASNQLRAQMELDKLFRPGDTAVVILPSGDVPADAVLVAQNHYRIGWSLALFLLFSLLLCLFGGWVGFKALFSFLFSCVVIWKAVIPLLLHGWPASWTCFAAVALLTAAILYLVAGFTRKGTAACLGSMLGLLIGLTASHLFSHLMKINGAVLPYSQALLYSGYDFLDLADLFIGAMILASSGAVMDLSMDIAAGMEEIRMHTPRLPRRALFASGIRIGRSVVGTMTTTLLLAYSGGYITLLMMFTSQEASPLEILNSPLVASEVVKTLIGSFSLVLVAPSTALFASILYPPAAPSSPFV